MLLTFYTIKFKTVGLYKCIINHNTVKSRS